MLDDTVGEPTQDWKHSIAFHHYGEMRMLTLLPILLSPKSIIIEPPLTFHNTPTKVSAFVVSSSEDKR